MERKTNIAAKKNYGTVRNTNSIKYIVIHYTGNDGDSDENNGKYFHNNIVKASAHIFVDSDSMTQSVPDNYIAYAVGGGRKSNRGGRLFGKVTNANSLSIELCDDFKNGVVYPTKETIENALVLVREKMAQYNIPICNVIRHFDVNGKICPAYWTDDKAWENDFWGKIETTPTLTPQKPVEPAPKPQPTNPTPAPSKPAQSGNEYVRRGQSEAVKFTGYSIGVDGIVGDQTRKMMVRVLQTAINRDYGAGLKIDGIYGNNTARALGNHYVKRGERQYMVTAAEILMYLHGYNPNGVEYPGKFGAGLEAAASKYFGGDGSKINCSDFRKLAGV